jgi:hypothetical protein
VEYLLMPNAIDFTSISMRTPPGCSRECGAEGPAWWYGHCLQRALRPGAAQHPLLRSGARLWTRHRGTSVARS